MFSFSDYEESASFLKNRMPGFVPKVLIILGSGLGGLGDRVGDAVRIPYREIPHFPVSSAPGHKGLLIAAELSDVPVLLMQGRTHVYEGFSAEEVSFPVRAAKLMGADTVILTNAAGAVNPGFSVGEFMLLSDFIRLPWANSLIGPNLDRFGPRFPDMSRVFSERLREEARQAAQEMGFEPREGVYWYCTGPNFETPAEIRAFRTLGADAVGMSTVHEAMTAAHAGMEVLGISLLTNMAAGISERPLSGEEVNAAAEKAAAKFETWILKILERIRTGEKQG